MALEEYGSFQWDSTILSVDGHIDSAVRELIRVATKLAGAPVYRFKGLGVLDGFGFLWLRGFG